MVAQTIAENCNKAVIYNSDFGAKENSTTASISNRNDKVVIFLFLIF